MSLAEDKFEPRDHQLITGEYVKAALTALEWSAAQLAFYSGVPERAVRRALTGPGEAPITIRHATAILRVLREAGVAPPPEPSGAAADEPPQVSPPGLRRRKEKPAPPEEPAPDVRALRGKLGMTRREFAETFGIRMHQLVDWENGEPIKPAAIAYLNQIMSDPALVRSTFERAIRHKERKS